jgi:hypothetical protein
MALPANFRLDRKSLKGSNALAYKCVASKRFIKFTTDENPEMIKEQTGVRE